MIKIKQVDNGVVVIDTTTKTEVVFEYHDDKEIDSFREVLYYLTEICGPETSRYSSKRIQINIVPGDKFEEVK